MGKFKARWRLGLGLMLLILLIGEEQVFAQSELSELQKKLSAQDAVILELKAKLEEVTQGQQETKAKLEELSRSQVTKSDVFSTVDRWDQQVGSKFFVTGYSSATYNDRRGENGSFDASLNPAFHFRLYDKLHVNSEIEVTLKEDEGTEVELEFAEADFFAHDNVILSAGKMLLPFNVFSERLHPGWINKLPSLPPIYGTHGGNAVSPGIVPVLTDLGVQARGGFELGEESMANYAIFLVNGPRAVEEEEGSMDGGSEEGSSETPEHDEQDRLSLEFGESSRDNNSNKVLGGRLGLIPISGVELGWSGFGGKYDDENKFFVWGSDAEWRYKGLELRGEYINLSADLSAEKEITQDGFYAQASFRPGRTSWTSGWPKLVSDCELIGRFGSAETSEGEIDQTALGLIYWVAESAPLKFSYEFNDGDGGLGDDRFVSEFAYGF